MLICEVPTVEDWCGEFECSDDDAADYILSCLPRAVREG